MDEEILFEVGDIVQTNDGQKKTVANVYIERCTCRRSYDCVYFIETGSGYAGPFTDRHQPRELSIVARKYM